MTTTTTSPFSIVVGLDFHDSGGYAFGQAARIASAIPSSQIHLVHVFEKELDPPRSAELIAQLGSFANDEAASLGGLLGTSVGTHLRVGDPAREIAQLARDIGANMIVVGKRRLPHLRSARGRSISRRLLTMASCPVLVAGPRPPLIRPEPMIEPPCADCVRARAESENAVWWCARHAHRAARAHIFSYRRELPLASHDSEVIPTGIDF